MRVEMPDGQWVVFPDDMPDSQIRDMIKKKYPNARAPTPTEAKLKSFQSYIPEPEEFAKGAVQGLAQIPAQILSNPFTMIPGVGQAMGLAGFGAPPIPGARAVQQFADQPANSLTNVAGNVAGSALPGPELGAGRYAVRYLPHALTAGAAATALGTHGLPGLAEVVAALGGGGWLAHRVPTLLRLARMASKFGPMAEQALEWPIEKLTTGAGTSAAHTAIGETTNEGDTNASDQARSP